MDACLRECSLNKFVRLCATNTETDDAKKKHSSFYQLRNVRSMYLW